MSLLTARAQRLKGELAWVLVGHAAAFAGGLLGIKILTRQLGAVGYGHLALGLTIAGFLTSFLHNPLSNAAARFYAPYRDTGRSFLYFAVLRKIHTQLLILLVPLIVSAVFLTYLLKDSYWGGLVLGGLLFGAISGIGVSFLAWQNAARDRKNATLAQIGDVWLRIGSAIVLVMLFGSGFAALGGYCIGALLVVLWQYLQCTNHQHTVARQEPPVQPDQFLDARHEFLLFVLPFVGYALFTVVALYADRWILQLAADTASVGVYAAMFQIASSPVNLLFAVVNQLMVPIVYERAGSMTSVNQRRESRRLIGRTILVTMFCVGAGVVLTMLLARPVVALLTTTEFVRHAGLLWMLVLGLALWQVGQLMALEGICANRPGIYLWPKGLHAAVLVVAGWSLVQKNGVAGMAIAQIVASIVYLVAVGVVNSCLGRQLQQDTE